MVFNCATVIEEAQTLLTLLKQSVSVCRHSVSKVLLLMIVK